MALFGGRVQDLHEYRVPRDFYYKGWRGESEQLQDGTQGRDQLQDLFASEKGNDMAWVLQQLLETGGDERSVTLPATGLTKYHTPVLPCQGIFRSSCTSNVSTSEAFHRGIDALRQLKLEARNISKQKNRDMVFSSPEDLFRKLLCDVRERLRSVFELSFEDTISLFPSGTDAEFMPALLGLMRAQSQSVRGNETFTVVTAAGEVGSGTTLAAMGKHFAKQLPSGRSVPVDEPSVFPESTQEGSITGLNVFMRSSDGKLLSKEERDQLVQDAVDEAAAAMDDKGMAKYGCVVVHMVVGSKTGVCMPSDDLMDQLVRQYGNFVLPVVDACQGRLGEGAIRSYLDKGRVVLCTGSKFFGGPPFSGVCLMSSDVAKEFDFLLESTASQQVLTNGSLDEYTTAPLISDDLPKLRSLLPRRALNYGVLMRWLVALHGMEGYYAEVPKDARVRLLTSWTSGVRQLIETKNTKLVQVLDDGDHQDRTDDASDEQAAALASIVSFHCRCNRGKPETSADSMTMDELRHVQLLMASDLSMKYGDINLQGPAKSRCFMGQPVDLSPGKDAAKINVLRVAASAPLILRAWQEGLEPVLLEDQALFEKLIFILENWQTLQPFESKM
eukprot:TRINITY_DN33902_c0_g1_i1.p1 TRINITY_DN33902_c0_g1~~TRINITY_DN33902_c0_g1_i1.p1  ORF type:complete len:614 (+),score=107.00 TRINITY_DN33902_c0_g1_i1:46-1887(+)